MRATAFPPQNSQEIDKCPGKALGLKRAMPVCRTTPCTCAVGFQTPCVDAPVSKFSYTFDSLALQRGIPLIAGALSATSTFVAKLPLVWLVFRRSRRLPVVGDGSAGWIVDNEILGKGWEFNSFELAF